MQKKTLLLNFHQFTVPQNTPKGTHKIQKPLLQKVVCCKENLSKDKNGEDIFQNFFDECLR